jgi:hypothetical protein
LSSWPIVDGSKLTRLRSILLSMLLLLSLIPAIAPVPSASSQTSSLTTSTHELYNNTFTIQGIVDLQRDRLSTCNWAYIRLGSEMAGTKVLGSITATDQIMFGILNSTQFDQNFVHTKKYNEGGECRFPSGAAALYAGKVTQYSFDWVVPNDDFYRFVFLNGNGIDVYITFEASTEMVSTVTPTEASSILTQPSATSIQTKTSTDATQPPPPSPIIGAWSSFLYVGVFLAVLLVLATAFLAVRKRTGIATSKSIRAGRRKAKQERRDFSKHSASRAIFRSAHERLQRLSRF